MDRRPRSFRTLSTSSSFAGALAQRLTSRPFAVVLTSILAAACTGDAFEPGGSGGGATSTSTSGPPATSTSSGNGGDGGASTTGPTTTGEGGSAVSTGDGGAGQGGDGGSPNEGGGGSGPVGDCDPELSGDVPIPDECGVFVDPNIDDDAVGAGTKSDPYRSISLAVDQTAAIEAPRIYVRAGTSLESVVLDTEGMELHGGLTDAWTFDVLGRTTIAQTERLTTATVLVEPNAVETLMSGFHVIGGSPAVAGQSSIAIMTLNAHLRLRRCTVEALDAAAGAPGSTPNVDIGAGDPDLNGELHNVATGEQPGLGGAAGLNDRDGCTSIGGRGGDGAFQGAYYEAGDGTPGTPGDALGGRGASRSIVTGTAYECAPGEDGDNGSPGSEGAGAQGDGSLSPVSGYVAPASETGTRGTVGRAGGGGGGGKPNDFAAGDGGNGGGAGGCGGFPGGSGQSGGSSVAILAIGGTLIFDDDVVLKAGKGGDGGDGSPGQLGAQGGTGSSAFQPGAWTACSGGDGGRGGRGGHGGGGSGGHSIGVAFGNGTEFIGSPTTALSVQGNAGAPGAAGVPLADNGLSETYRAFAVVEE